MLHLSNNLFKYKIEIVSNQTNKNSFQGDRCPIGHIDALSLPFLMGDEKGIDIDARLRSLMPSGTPVYRSNEQ